MAIFYRLSPLAVVKQEISSEEDNRRFERAVKETTGEEEAIVHKGTVSVIENRGQSNKKTKSRGKVLWTCDECTYQTFRKDDFDRHYKQHTGERTHPCPHCPKKFIQKVSLKEHILGKHEDKRPYPCKKCDYKAVKVSHLNQHIQQKHTLVKRFQCKLCDYQASRNYHIKQHTRNKHK